MRTLIVIRIIFGFVHWTNVVIFLGVAFATNTRRAFRTPCQHQFNDYTEKQKREHANGKATRDAGKKRGAPAVSKYAADSHAQDYEPGVCLV